MSKQPQSLAEIMGQTKINPITAPNGEEEEQLAASVNNVIGKSPAAPSAPTAHPATIQESMSIIQPKTLTYAAYDITQVQEDMLTLIADNLQRYAAAQSSLIRPDLFGQLSVDLDLGDFPVFDGNKRKFIQAIDNLRHVDFEFGWRTQYFSSTEGHQMFVDEEVDTKGTIISTRHDIKRTSKVVVVINPWCIPYLLYYGKKIGGTKYYKNIALSIKHKYSKRLYKLIMDWHTMGDRHEESLSDFRYFMQLPESYDNNKIKTAVLEPAKTDIAQSGSHITFDYQLLSLHPTGQTKPAADTIVFTFSGNHAKKTQIEKQVQIMTVLLQDIADAGRDMLCAPAASRIVQSGKYPKIYKKFEYYTQKYKEKQIDKEHYKTTMLKIVLEETGEELRSPEHILNSQKLAQRTP